MRKMKNVMIKMVMIGFMGLLLAGFVPMTASAEEEAVSYIDADGSTKTITEYTVVTTEMEGVRIGKFVSNSSNGFLYVKNSVVLNGASSDGTGTQNLILGDGATLTINGYMEFNDSLNIFCQSGGTGKLKINADIYYKGAMNIDNSHTLTINGGIIEAENLDRVGYGFYGGDFVMNGGTVSVKGGSAGSGIACSYGNTIVYNGGNLIVSGGDGGIYCNSVTLNYKSSDDRIKVRNYYYSQNVTVTIADGKYFKDDAGNFYSGTLTADEITTISGKELRPAYSYAVTIADGITNGTVTATDVVYTTVSESPQTIALEDATVTLTATPASGYELSTLTVTGDTTQEQVTVNGSDNTRTFTMPSENVTVSATFRQIPVKYLDESGTEKSCTNYTVLTGGDYDQIGSGTPEKWYVVNSDIHFDSLLLKGNVNIILVDGQTVTFGYENNPIYSNYGILSEYNNNDSKVPLYDLKIYGQSLGTGALTIYEKSSQESEPESISVYIDEYYQYGGKVTIKNTGNNGIGIKTKGRVELKNNSSLSVTTTGGDAINTQDLVDITNAIVTAEATGTGGCAIYSPNGIRITNSKITAKATGTDGCAIGSDHRISITDSQVTATGANAGIKTDTVSSEGTVALSLSGADNFVQASNYVANTVYAAEGKYLTDEGGNLYGGAVITKLTASDIANKKLIPAYGVGIAADIEHGTVTASPKGFRKDAFTNANKTVTLSITPDLSYTLSTLTVTGDTSHASITPDKISDNEYTFTMPAESPENVTVSATFTQPAVKYLDASGTEQSCSSYTALGGGHATTLDGGWYVVPKNKTATYTGTLTLNGHVNLILEDGAKLNVGAENSPIPGIGINSNGYNLTVYGQSTDAATAGTLKVYSSSNNEYNCGGISLTSARFTLNGGNVLVSSTGNQGNGIYGDDFTMNGGNLDVSSAKHAAIYTFYDITINGGSVSATGYDCGLHAANGSIKINGGSVTASVTGTPGYANPAIYTSNGKNSATNTANSITVNGGNVTANSTIKANGTNDGEGSIILGFSNVADSIEAAGYIAGDRGSVKVAEDKCFCTAGNDSKACRGTLTSDQLNAIANKKLYPAYGVFIGSVTNGTVSASPEAFAMTDFDSAYKTVILTVNPADGYATGIVSYNDGSDHQITPVNGGYSFSMPAKNVTVSATFPKSLAHSDITVEDIADQTYTGSAITPGVTVKDGDETLKQGTDYTVSYKNNVNAAAKDVSAAPTVIISGMGNYGGEKEVTFSIGKKAITPAVSITGWTYGSAANAPSVTADSNPGGGGVSYTYYTDENCQTKTTTANGASSEGKVPKSAGTYYVKGTVEQTDNYAGGTSAAVSFTIAKKSVTITELSAENKTYDGNTTAAVKGTASINGAKSGDDVSVLAGTAAFADKNAGTGKTVTFSGYSLTGTEAGNYELSAQPADVTADITAKPVTIRGLTVSGKTYDGTTGATVDCSGATFTGKIDGDTISVSGVTGTFADKDVADGKIVTLNYGNAVLGGTDAGNYTIAESENQAEATAAITKKTVSAVSEISRTYLYTAGGQESIDIKALLPADCGTDAYTVTKSGSVPYSTDPAVADGILTYTVDPGTKDTTGTIIVKAETLNYTDITITVHVELTDQKPVELKDGASVELNKSTLTYGEALLTLTFMTDTAIFAEKGNTSNVIAGSLSWKTPTAVPAAGTTSATWVFTPSDAAYASFEGIAAITVNKAIPGITSVPEASAITYGKTLADSTFSNGAATVEGTFAWSDRTIKPTVSDSNKTCYEVVFTPADTTNYETASCELTLTVNKADIPAKKITPPTANSLTYTGSAQELIYPGAVSDGLGTMKYAFAKVSDTDNLPAAPAEEAAYNSSVPTAIKGGNYCVWYMVKGDANHKDKTPASVTVTISKAGSKSEEMKTIEVQTGSGVPVSVNLKAYLGENAILSNPITKQESETGTLTFSDIKMESDQYTLSFKATSLTGGTGSITIHAATENHQDYWLTVPVEAKAKTTEVKLETAGTTTAVEGAAVNGLEAYTNSQTGDSVKVELDVKTVNEPTDESIKTNIENKISLIYPGMSTEEVKKEYLDISVNKTVNDGTAQPVHDLGRVVEIAVNYDLSGKINPVVIREHDQTVTAFTALSQKPVEGSYQDGTFYIDLNKGIIYIYTEFFSTYSIAYATTDSYTVSFDAQGGSGVNAIVVKAGGTIPAEMIPKSSKNGYSLDGWFTAESGGSKLTSETVINSDITYYAQWTRKSSGGGGTGGGGVGGTPVPVTYTVRFDMNEKTVADAPANQSVAQGGTAVRPAKDPEADGFTFAGWYREAAGENLFDFSTPITADTVIYAKWTEKKAETFTVTFDLNGKPGTAPAAQTVEKDGCAKEPAAPEAEGFRFAGWYSEATCENLFDFSTPITADTIIYAKWIDEKAEFFTVTFDLNGKPGTTPSAQTVEKDRFAKEPAVPEADGFTFTGWFTDAACKTKYDFSTPVTTDLTLYAGWKAVEPEPVVIDEGDAWNLYEDASEHEYQIRGISVDGTVSNSNSKSKVYYDAKITGSTITVKVTGDRKKAALASNALLEFDLGSAGVVEYALPVSYVKPVFKLSSTTATIKSGKETTLKTTVLVKNADGSFAPYDMTDVQVSGSNFGTVTKGEDGSIEVRTSAAGSGKISIVKDAWDGAKAVNLAYTVKGSKKDVLSVDLQGLKTVVVNSNAKGQAFGFDVMFNGASVSSSDLLAIVDKKNTGLATISDDGKLVIAYKDGVKNGTYLITLQSKESKEAKTNVRIRVNGKKLDKAITTRILRKYDVVTKQSMVVVPNLRDVGGRIERVSVAEAGFTAKLNAAGNIEIDYIGDTNDTESSKTSEKNGVESAGTDAANAAENASTEEKYNVKNLNIGTLTLSLTITGIDDPVTLPLKNVRAKKTTPTAKVGIVTIPAGVTPAEGQVIGTANIVSTYKVSSGMCRTIKPVKAEILGKPKGVTAKVHDSDPSEIDIYSISKKNAQIRVKLTYAGGVTKTVTVRVKKK